MGACHDQDSAVYVVGEQVGDEAGFVALKSSLREYILSKLRRYPVPVLETERAKAFYFRDSIGLKVQFLRLDGAKMREVPCPSGEGIYPHLKPFGDWSKTFAGMEKGALRFVSLKLNSRRHGCCPRRIDEKTISDFATVFIMNVLEQASNSQKYGGEGRKS
jgi:hypothetical protein